MPLLVNLPDKNDFEYKKNSCELFFEHFQAPHFFMATECMLHLYACGKTNGIIVDLGHSFTKVDSIIGGQVIPFAGKKQAYSGFDLNNEIARLLSINYH